MAASPYATDDALLAAWTTLSMALEDRNTVSTAIELVTTAVAVAASAHGNQRRASGEPYLCHPLAVATIVADLGLDAVAIAAAVCHDVIEDTDLDGAGLDAALRRGLVGSAASAAVSDVVAIVEGVTKLDGLTLSGVVGQAASLTRMLVAVSEDLRVLVVKLADRAHNMSTLGALAPHKQVRIANETLEVYAPLAHRLGFQALRRRLEDAAFATLHPGEHAALAASVAERVGAEWRDLDAHRTTLELALAQAGITATVVGREKHLWSIWQKMSAKGRPLDEIWDLIALRVIVADGDDHDTSAAHAGGEGIAGCYAAVGVVHSLWRPLPERFKDYVALPRSNGYRSLHTTVVGPGGRPVEVQVRTRTMHDTAELGFAAHWAYKEARAGAGVADHIPGAELQWLRRLVDWRDELLTGDDTITTSGDYLSAVRADLASAEVYVFTPKGRLVDLPEGSTPLDFAYAVHSQVGDMCVGAKVNGRIAKLSSPLANGDVVEILTREGTTPHPDWLTMVVTARARGRIRRALAATRRPSAIALGRTRAVAALTGVDTSALTERGQRRHADVLINASALDELLASVAATYGMSVTDSFLAQVGDSKISEAALSERAKVILNGETASRRRRLLGVKLPVRERGRSRSSNDEAWADGLPQVALGTDGHSAELLVSFAECCNVTVGDPAFGYVSSGRGLRVHRLDCASAQGLRQQRERLAVIAWGAPQAPQDVISIEVRALDGPSLLSRVAGQLSANGLFIGSASTRSFSDGTAVLFFDVEGAEATLVDAALVALSKMGNVFEARRAPSEDHRPESDDSDSTPDGT